MPRIGRPGTATQHGITENSQAAMQHMGNNKSGSSTKQYHSHLGNSRSRVGAQGNAHTGNIGRSLSVSIVSVCLLINGS